MLRSLGLGLGLETFAKFLRVLVSVPDNLVSGKKSRFRFQKNLVSEKSLGFGFGKFGIGKKVLVSVSVKILVSSFSDQELHKMKKCPYMYQDKLRSKPKCEIIVFEGRGRILT